MSTKIPTGFWVSHGNPARLMKQLKKLQLQHTEWALAEASAYLPAVLDSSEYGKNEAALAALYQYRLMADVIIYFFEKKILGTYFIQDHARYEWFRGQRWFRDYHYQTQVDKGSLVSYREWCKREQDWNFLNVPADDGFTFYLVNPVQLSVFWVQSWRDRKKSTRPRR